MENEVVSKIGMASKYYEDNTVLRTLINGIPYVGGSLDVIFAYKGRKIIQERLNVLLGDLKSEMEKVKETQIDKDYLESEEYFDLLITALGKATKTRRKKKIALFAKILKNAVLVDKDKVHNKPEDYLSTITELTEDELLLAKTIYQYQADKPHVDGAADGYTGGKEEVFLLKRIERTGLISEITGGYMDYAGGDYIITETFKKIMNFIDNEWPDINHEKRSF